MKSRGCAIGMLMAIAFGAGACLTINHYRNDIYIRFPKFGNRRDNVDSVLADMKSWNVITRMDSAIKARDICRERFDVRLIASLVESLSDENQVVRREAASGLSRLASISSVMAVPALAQSALEGETDVAALSIRALSKYGISAKPALPKLLRIMDHPPNLEVVNTSNQSRISVVEPLVNIAGDEPHLIIEPLKRHAKDTDPWFALSVNFALLQLNSKDREAETNVINALADRPL